MVDACIDEYENGNDDDVTRTRDGDRHRFKMGTDRQTGVRLDMIR